MIILDVIIIIFIALVTYGGYKRGIILEAFDIVIIFLDFGISTHICPYLAKVFDIFLRWPKSTSSVVSFILIFIPVGIVLYLIALTVDRAAKLDVVAKGFNSYAGAAVAFIKSWILTWTLILVVFMLPLKEDVRKEMHNSFMVNIVKARTSMMLGIIEATSPPVVNKEFIKVIKKNKFL